MNFDQLFDEFWGMAPVNRWQPACDIEETEDHYLLTLDIPGVPRDQIKLEVLDGQLLVAGERRQSERRLSKFQRSFTLPSHVDTEKVEANYQDGTLRIYLPKAESAKPRQIKITNGSGQGFFARLMDQSPKERAAS